MKDRKLRLLEKTTFIVALVLVTNVLSVVSAQDEVTRLVPLFPSSNDPYSGALRIINHSKEAGDVSIVGFDEEGTEYGPAMLSIGSQTSQLIYTDELENGTETLAGGLGRGIGSWRLQITTQLDIEASAYATAQNGLLSSLQETVQGENGCWRIPTFYSADNFAISKLRLTNSHTDEANVKISGRDDRGTVSASPIEFSLAAGTTKTFDASDLEGGVNDFSGSLGNGRGNWQLAVESDRLITVMNLLEGDRTISNLSKRPSHAIGHCWLGKTLANADRSIVKRLEVFVLPDRLEETAPITPAIYAAIIDEAGVRAVAATGVKKIDGELEASIHDRLHLGSITKPMTATMIATLIHEDQSVFSNGWDTSIQDVFSDLVDDIHEDYHEVTIKELLIHHSGVRSLLPEWDDDEQQNITERRKAAMLATLAEEAPTERGVFTLSSYSHVGYMVAAAMVEKLTGRTWEIEMQERLFQPLGMVSAGFGPPALLDNEGEPWGHTLSADNEWEPTTDDWHIVLRPTAGVHSSVEDLAKFVQLWMDDKEPMLLNRLQLQELTRLAFRADGSRPLASLGSGGGSPSAGWWVYPNIFGFDEALNTPGSNGNWYSNVWVMRDISRAYLVVTNSVLPDDRFGARASLNRVLSPAIRRLMTSPARSEPPRLSNDALN